MGGCGPGWSIGGLVEDHDRGREEAVKRLKEDVSGVPAERVLSEELIAGRREEARREETELEAGEITRRLRGPIGPKDGGTADEGDYRGYLERKHGRR